MKSHIFLDEHTLCKPINIDRKSYTRNWIRKKCISQNGKSNARISDFNYKSYL